MGGSERQVRRWTVHEGMRQLATCALQLRVLRDHIMRAGKIQHAEQVAKYNAELESEHRESMAFLPNSDLDVEHAASEAQRAGRSALL